MLRLVISLLKLVKVKYQRGKGKLVTTKAQGTRTTKIFVLNETGGVKNFKYQFWVFNFSVLAHTV